MPHIGNLPSTLGFAHLFRAFRHRNFRLFTIGQTLSMIGSWAQRLAVSWLAWQLTQSAFWVGAVSFAGLFPGFLMGPISGTITDRGNRLRLLKLTQFAFMLQAVILSALTIAGVVTIELLLILEAILAIITSLDIPVRQSLVITMVGREDLPNAIALNSSFLNITRMIGPVIAGIIIVSAGIGEAFLFNAISYIAVIASIYMMRIEDAPRTLATNTMLRHTREGLAYAWQHRTIRRYLLLLTGMALFGMPYGSLLPVFADLRFGVGASGLSWLVGGSGIGAVAGALYLASRKRPDGLPRLVPAVAVLFGIALVAFSLSQNFVLSLCIIPFSGFGMLMQLAGNNTILQMNVDEEQRGRVMSLLSMAFQFGLPVGSLLFGWAADAYGLTAPLAIGGFACIVIGLITVVSERNRKPE